MPGTDAFGWGLVPLGSTCNINPKKSLDSRLVSGVIVSFVPMPAVTEHGEIDATAIKEYDEVKTGFTYFAENDVLFAKITPCMENGKGAVAKGLHNGIGFGSTEFHVLRPISGKTDPYWIYTLTAFSQFRMDAASNMTGSAGQRRVPASFLENYRVSLPPIALQEQFAAFVEQTDKSRFIELFGDPVINPKGFPCYTVGEVIDFQGGSQPDKKYFEYEASPDNIRLIQIRDYKSDKYITYIPKTMAKRFCTADDIMIGRYGPPIFQILKGIEGSFNVALMKATPKIGNREFVRQFLKQDCLLEYLEGLSKRTAGQDGIQMDKLKAYPFPYPPIELQEQFASFVEQTDKSKYYSSLSFRYCQAAANTYRQEWMTCRTSDF